MKVSEFEIRFISPLINHRNSYDDFMNEKDLTLLPQTIRGILRFYYRTIAARIFLRDISKMLELEKKLFGSTDNKSLFDVMVIPININLLKLSELDGLKYPLYGIYKSKKQERILNEKIFLPSEGSKFLIRFIFYKNNVSKLVSEFINYLFLFVSLVGGFGGKVKKGFGQFEIVNSSSFEINDINLEKLDDLLLILENKIKELYGCLLENNFKLEKNYANKAFIFPAFVDGYYKIYKLDKNFNNFKEALKEVFNSNNDFSYIKIKRKLRGNAFKIAKENFYKKKEVFFNDALLGLPVIFFEKEKIKGSYKSFKINNYKLFSKDENNEYRKSSNLTIKLFKNNNKYYVYFIYFKAFVKPENSSIIFSKIENKKIKYSKLTVLVDYQALESLIEKYKDIKVIK